MVQQAEARRGMVKRGISRLPQVIILALMVRVADIALLDIGHPAVYAFATAYLASHATMTFQAQDTLASFKRLVAASALRLEGFV